MKTVELGQVAVIERNGLDPLSLPPETRYLGLEHIERGGRILGHGTVAGAELRSTKFKFTEDHVLFGKLRPNLAKIARPGFWGVCSTDILPIRPGQHLDRDYLAHFLAQPAMVEFAASRATGVNLPRLSPTVLAGFPLPLPPLAEQRRIAAILDQADAIRAQRRKLPSHLDTLSVSTFHSMFGAIGREYWKRIPLGELAAEIESGTSPICENRPAGNNETGVLKLGAVTYGVFQPQENKAYLGEIGGMMANEVRRGDVLMTRKNTRELVGAVALVGDVRKGLLLPDLIFRLNLDERQLDRRYFQALMMHPGMRPKVRDLSNGSAGSMPNISKARLRGLQVALPPLSLQRQFSARMEKIEAHRTLVRQALATDNELYASLQYRAFRGEL